MRLPYVNHGHRHAPRGSDPVIGGLPPWTEIDPAFVTINDGSLDTDLSYVYVMQQGSDLLDSVAVQMRLVAAGSFEPQITNLPGLDFSVDVGTAVLFAGLCYTTTTGTWDTPHHAYMLANGQIVYPFDTPGAAAGDIFFVGGGIYPYGVTWPAD